MKKTEKGFFKDHSTGKIRVGNRPKGGWMGAGKSRLKDCLQQLKKLNSTSCFATLKKNYRNPNLP